MSRHIQRLLMLLAVLFVVSAARADDVLEPVFCGEYTSFVCNESVVPGAKLDGALEQLYYRPSIINSWRLAQSPGTMNPTFVAADGTAVADSFMSGVTMPAPGFATLMRANQTGGSFAVQYTLQVNGLDTELTIAYDEFSPTANDNVSGAVQWEAGDVLTMKVTDATVGEPTRTYITLSGYFL